MRSCQHIWLGALISAVVVSAQSQGSLLAALSNDVNLSNLTSILNEYPSLSGTLNSLENITFLAPNNAAITALLNSSNSADLQPRLNSLVAYHVLSGSYASLPQDAFISTSLTNSSLTNVTDGQVVHSQGSTILSGLLQISDPTGQPLNFSGGVVHIIDRVLTIPSSLATTALSFNLTSMLGAFNATGTLATGNAASTMFIPSNSAFQSIGSILTNLTTEEATSVLQCHIVNETNPFYLLDSSQSSVLTSGGQRLSIRRIGDSVFVNNAKITVPNVLTANGVVHVIDQVLNPGNLTTPTFSADDSGIPAWSGASAASEAPFTSGILTPTSAIPTIASSSATATSNSNSSQGHSTSGGHTGAIVGGVVGGIVGLAVVVFGIWYVRHKGYSLQLQLHKKPPTTMGMGVAAMRQNDQRDAEFDQKAELPATVKSGVVRSRAELDAEERRLAELEAHGQRRHGEISELEATERVAK